MLSNQADHCKNTGGDYGNVFCLIEAVGLLKNGTEGEGEWSGMLRGLQIAVNCIK